MCYMLTNLDELLFLIVFAFPNASSRGFEYLTTFLTWFALSPPPDILGSNIL